MAKRTILVDSARRELEKHGTETFPMTVNHDDLWSFEGKNVPIHWHNDLEINLIREGEAVFQVYQKSYRVRTGDGMVGASLRRVAIGGSNVHQPCFPPRVLSG